MPRTTLFSRSHLVLAAAIALSAVLAVLPVHGGPATQLGTQPGLTHDMLTPDDCGSCHGDYDEANHIEPFPTWAGSMMANASRDPLFWAALDVANNDLPGIGDFCLRCHAPAAWLAGRSEPPLGSVDGCALEGKIDELGGDFDGLTCHLCHRMMENSSPPAGQLSLYLENGQYWIDDVECAGGAEIGRAHV